MINAPDAIRHVLVTNHENYGRNNAHQARAAAGARQRAAPRESAKRGATSVAPSPRRSRRAPCPCSRATSSWRRRRRKPSSPAPPGAAPSMLLQRLQHLALTVAGRSMFSLEMARVRRRAARHAAPLREGLRAARLPRPAPSDLDALAARHRPRRLPGRMAAARGPPDRRAGAAGGARAGRPAARPLRPARRRARPGDRRGLRPGATPRRGGDADPCRARDHRGLAVLGLLRGVPPAGAPGAHRGRGGRRRPLGGQRRGRAQAAALHPRLRGRDLAPLSAGLPDRARGARPGHDRRQEDRARHGGQHLALGAAPPPPPLARIRTASTRRGSCPARRRRSVTPTCPSAPGRACASARNSR